MVACLRMLLAHLGRDVTEASLVEQIELDQGGVDPDQLAALARQLGLKAEARQLDFDSIVGLVREELFPIIVVDRFPLDREFSVHAVIPFRISRLFVTALDPLRGERRFSRRKFIKAHSRVDRWAVVWEP